jgi:hypothetical protein
VRRSSTEGVDQRGVTGQTWQGIVWTALIELGNRASLAELYEAVQDHARVKIAAQRGIDWRAIIRRVVQETCMNVERGVWALPAYKTN